jgi:heme-degrading monooxygenase HmoA
MPKLPWTPSETAAAPDQKYLVMASFLPLKSLATTVRFMRYVMAIRNQLRTAEGLIGYALWAKPMSKRYWTLSVWRSEEALQRFMETLPHAHVMKDLRPRMNPTKFVRWNVPSSAAHPTWDEALARLAE